MGDRRFGPGQGVEGGEQAGLVVFDAEDEVRVALVQVVRVGALGVQTVLCGPDRYADGCWELSTVVGMGGPCGSA
jgi:hypothetical protein